MQLCLCLVSFFSFLCIQNYSLHCLNRFLWSLIHVLLSSVYQWGTEEVGAWLDFLCLAEYKDIFIGHDVRGAELIHLERRDLKVA